MIDASVLIAFYAADHPRRDAVVDRLAVGNALFTPAYLDVEVVSALRGMAQRSPLLRPAVPTALRHLTGHAIRRMPLAPLLQRMWQLRESITAYDAAYVPLAERLDAPLVISDNKLAATSGPRCTFGRHHLTAGRITIP